MANQPSPEGGEGLAPAVNRPTVNGDNQQVPRLPFTVDFIDPLFAIAIHIGFAEGLFSEGWFHQWTLPKGDDFFNLSVFLLGLLTLTLSWVGYHNSIRVHPIQGRYGRFILDVVLVCLYAVMLAKYKDLGAVLFVLASIFTLFLVWDLIKVWEYWDEFDRKKKSGTHFLRRFERQRITVLWMIVFILLFAAHHYGFLGRESVLVLAFLSTVGYRVDKAYDLHGSLILIIGQAIRDGVAGNRRS